MSSPRSSRRSQINAIIESLEIRRLLSADLTGMFTGTLPAEIHTGNNNHLAIRVVNEGDVPARGKVAVDLFAQPDSSETGDDGDVLLGTVLHNVNLKSGGGANVKMQFADPPTLADGQYSLVAQIDASQIPNVNTTDAMFVAPSTISVNQPSADLQSQMVSGPTSPIVIDGSSVSGQPASVLVKNVGNVAAKGDVSLNFYLSADQTLDSGDLLAGTLSGLAVKLKPGKGEVFSDMLVPPSGTAASNYYLFAVVTSGAGISQKPGETGIGIAPTQVVVQRPAGGGGSIDQTNDGKTPSFPYEGTPATPVTQTPAAGATVTAPATGSDCPTPPACDDGSSSSCDDGSQGADCSDGSDDSQTTDDGSGDQSDQGQDDSGQQDTSGQTTDDSGQTDTSQDNSGQTTDTSPTASDGGQDDSGQSTDDSSAGSDSGTDTGSDTGSNDSSGGDSGSNDFSGGDSSGGDFGGDDSSGDVSGDDGTDALSRAPSLIQQPPVSTAAPHAHTLVVPAAGGVGHGGLIRQ